jgi:nitroimidazol reductase NimA-like FMN-containing flavoprotein (pyridoxamine 5'-phosphate oxidase superfamily)
LTTAPADRAMKQMVELTRSECLSLLAANGWGRVAVTLGGRPVIRPVNYVFDGSSQSVVFRTAHGSKFYALVHSARAAFEIDAIDEAGRFGWSVIIMGITEEVTRPIDVQRLNRLGLESWAPGPAPHWIQIRARVVSGRRIVLGRTSSTRHETPVPAVAVDC